MSEEQCSGCKRTIDADKEGADLFGRFLCMECQTDLDVLLTISNDCSHEVAQIEEDRNDLKARHDKLARMLRSLEWRGEWDNVGFQTCPACGGTHAAGHYPACELAALLAEEDIAL